VAAAGARAASRTVDPRRCSPGFRVHRNHGIGRLKLENLADQRRIPATNWCAITADGTAAGGGRAARQPRSATAGQQRRPPDLKHGLWAGELEAGANGTVPPQRPRARIRVALDLTSQSSMADATGPGSPSPPHGPWQLGAGWNSFPTSLTSETTPMAIKRGESANMKKAPAGGPGCLRDVGFGKSDGRFRPVQGV